MEACHAEGSKSGGDAVPPIPLRSLAHQNCICREPIVAPTRDEFGQSFGIVLGTNKENLVTSTIEPPRLKSLLATCAF
jgi:hypothetical protein